MIEIIAMNIDKELISRLESLARLKLTDEERETLRNDLEAILQMVEKMNELDEVRKNLLKWKRW